jgi:predicted alpha/beta-hydrolase family hydrolase
VKIKLPTGSSVSAILTAPPRPAACFVFAHGAGAGMKHSFMTAVAEGLLGRGIATLRYQFPYMEKGEKRPDRPELAHETVRAAVKAARAEFKRLPIIAGGKSFGGRMTSQAQAASPMPCVVGLAFFGFPLHSSGKPSSDRANHLNDVTVPMLFLQGSRDALAELQLLNPVVMRLDKRATLFVVDDADHSFHVPKRSGRTDAQVMGQMLDEFSRWSTLLSQRGQPPYAADRIN